MGATETQGRLQAQSRSRECPFCESPAWRPGLLEGSDDRQCGRWMRMRRGALSPQVRTDVRALLSLPRLSASDGKCLRDQRPHRDRPDHTSFGRSGPRRNAHRKRPPARRLSLPSLSDCRLERLWRSPSAPLRPRGHALDDPAALPPDVHIFTRSKLPWIELPETVPAFDVYYDMEALWPAASLERRRAILG